MTARPALPALAFAVVLTACSSDYVPRLPGLSPDPDPAASSADLVGLPESVLRSCAGVPARSSGSGGVQYLTYQTANITADERSGRDDQVSPDATGPRFQTDPIPRGGYCEAMVTVIDRRVAAVDYVTSGGFSNRGACAGLLSSCVGLGAGTAGAAP
jgi:hypothetical protein